ncbi:MAG: argininosuccinate lyase [Caldilineaceae bacterium]|nr:argininosuccinate lyase [Caldilineaceae bacterium]
MSTFPHDNYARHVLLPAYDDALTYLFEPMLAAHEAHALMLGDCGVLSPENVQAILQAVAYIRTRGPDHLQYQSGIEDLFFRVEKEIIGVAGADFGGNLQLARSRNDLGQALARMAFRTQVINLADALMGLRRAVLTLAGEHVETVMPGYTHTQPAQPTTFAHYLAGVLTFLEGDQQRVFNAYANVNESPLGAAAFTGTGFPVDRALVAEFLGFDAVIQSTHHSIGAGDHLTDVAFAVQSLCIGLGRVTRDLLFLATQEAGALHIDDSFIQISSIMPQKRNPVVLEHLRARLGRAVGFAQTVVTNCHNIPYGDTQDIEDEIMPPLMAALATAQDCLELYTSVFETLKLNVDHLARRAGEGFTTATELADTLVRVVGLPFRTAHHIVATMVKTAVAAGVPSTALTLPMLQAAAEDVTGEELEFSEDQFRQALDPRSFIDVRNGPGGVAPESTEDLLDVLAEQLVDDNEWLSNIRHRLAAAEQTRHLAVKTICKK